MLLSAHVERVSVSRRRDFFKGILLTTIVNTATCVTYITSIITFTEVTFVTNIPTVTNVATWKFYPLLSENLQHIITQTKVS